ncbi:sugar transferase [Oceanicaulis sp. UBA2681]|uniref:sugar transferase n=1 Tax=Oceanicaulis sp. UBA2681 TaxID=1947007 RepID=UPI00257D9051|nr:sugar transferase [Oceanicaulis sp. UBA2681]|tara:strand:- start:1021 stop:1707 length:687 start_codon:yes stop_codon:yes gene_type:complete
MGRIMDGSAHHLKLEEFPMNEDRPWFQRASKRVLDISLALAGLIILSPVLITVAALVRLQDKGPSIFTHTRIGQNGKPFKCYKFRSMVMDAPERLERVLATDPEASAEWARAQKLRKDPRITKFGGFLRRSSLDELPQLLNILRGEMSIVGPRPIVMDEVRRYGSQFEAYKAVRPGVTGLWQVSGRNDLSYDERVEMDARYAREWTMLGDIWIIIKTIPAVILSRGAS